MVALDHHDDADGRSAQVVRMPHGREGWRDSGEPRRPPLRLEWAHEIHLPQTEWLIKRLLPSSGLASIHGQPRTAKTFLAIDWALRLASGLPVLGRKTRRVGVAYIAAEAPSGARLRVKAQLKHNDLEHDEDRIPFALIARSLDITSADTEDVQQLIEQLDAAAIEFSEFGAPLGVVFVDTLARSIPGADENSSVDMGSALAALHAIGEATGALVCVVHHTGKDASKGPRGHSSFFAALDTDIELSFLDEDNGVRQIKVAKQKEDEDGQTWAFRLKPVHLGEDADGDPITSCVIDYVDEPAAPARTRPLKPDQKIVLEALDAVLSTEGRRAPPGVPASAQAFVADRETVRNHAFRIGLSRDGGSSSAPRMRWNRALEALCASNHVKTWESEHGEAWLWRV